MADIQTERWSDIAAAQDADIARANEVLIRALGRENAGRGRVLRATLAQIDLVQRGATQSITFNDSGWKLLSGVTVPSLAARIEVVSYQERTRGLYRTSAALFRSLAAQAVGDAPSDATCIPLATYGFVGSLRLGRAGGDGVLLAYDGGFASLPAGNVEVWTS